MEVTALCFRLIMNVLMLLVAHVQQSSSNPPDAAFRIVPTRLQLFEYQSVSFTCEGVDVSAGWKVKNINESLSKCSDDTVTCTIDFAFVSDSGEYWCEGGGGERSNTVSITVTDGSVILESPYLPVMEGNHVTLSCRNKTTSSNLTADFYKDGRLISSSSTGNMSIHSVSKSDEGLYKCHISGAGGSAENRLAVNLRDVEEKNNTAVKQREDSNIRSTSKTALDKDKHFARHYFILLWTVISVVLFLQLLLMGLLYWKKQLDTTMILKSGDSEAKLNIPNKDVYAVVKKSKKKKKTDPGESFPQTFHSTFIVDGSSAALQNEAGVSTFTVTSDRPLTDQDPQYDVIQEVGQEETIY